LRRRHAEEFAAALEGRGSRASSSDPNIVPLLNLAQQLQALPLGPAPAFRDSLRQRLVAVAAVAEPAAVPTPVDRVRTRLGSWRLQRAAQVAAAGLAAVVAITGVGTVSARSIPGDPLYGVKRAAERVQLDLARNDVNRGKRELQHAATRLDEVAALAAGESVPDPERIVDTLADMDAQTRRGVALLFDESAEAQSAELIAHVQDFAAAQQAELTALMDDLPDEARPRAATSLALLARIRRTTAAELADLATCTGVCEDVTGDNARQRARDCDCAPEPGPVRRIPVGGTKAPAPVTTPRAPARVPRPAPVVTSSTAPRPTTTGAPAVPVPKVSVPTPRTTTVPEVTATAGIVLTPSPPSPLLPTPVASTITELLEDLPPAPSAVATGPIPSGAATPLPVP
jgi:hypothetical protein